MAGCSENGIFALCILPHSKWPVKVQVDTTIIKCGKKNCSEYDGHRVYLNCDTKSDLQKWLSHKTGIDLTLWDGNEVVVPAKFILYSASSQLTSLEGCENLEIFAWAPLAYKMLGFIPCMLKGSKKFTKSETNDQECTIYTMVKHTNTGLKHRTSTEDGFEYCVPINQIFYWNGLQNLMLHARKMQFESCKLWEDQTNSSILKYVELSYIDLNEHDNKALNMEALNKALPSISAPPALKRETLSPSDTKKLAGDYFPEKPSHKSVVNIKRYGIQRKDSLRKINRGPTHPEKKASRKRRTKASIPNPSPEIEQSLELFGNCFTFGNESFREVPFNPNGSIKKGEFVAATHEFSVQILGNIQIAGLLPELNASELFVGVAFEHALKKPRFVVRHVTGDKETCKQYCKNVKRPCEGRYVFIPAKCLTHPDSAHGFIRLLNDGMQKQRERPDKIEIDYDLEAGKMSTFQKDPLGFDEDDDVLLDGVEGHYNSCYFDAVIFSLFAFTNVFDKCLDENDGTKDKKIAAARNILKYDIISPLRSNGRAEWMGVYKLRTVLSDFLNEKNFLGDFMDAEELIESLFRRTFQCPEFFQLGDDNKDYVLQILFPEQNESCIKKTFPSVQQLLEGHLNTFQVQFDRIPDPALIIKLPVCAGVSQFPKVYPNLELNLDSILKNGDGRMFLRAVICLKSSHFTCFVYSNGRWFYQDTLGNEQSNIKEISDLHKDLEALERKKYIRDTGNEMVEFLLKNAYICIYEPKIPNLKNQK